MQAESDGCHKDSHEAEAGDQGRAPDSGGLGAEGWGTGKGVLAEGTAWAHAHPVRKGATGVRLSWWGVGVRGEGMGVRGGDGEVRGEGMGVKGRDGGRSCG